LLKAGSLTWCNGRLNPLVLEAVSRLDKSVKRIEFVYMAEREAV
jgi:hypothetical protein